MSESLIIDWESLNTCDKEGNRIVKEIPIYKTGIYKGKLWLDKNGPLLYKENLGYTGYELLCTFFDIRDENTGASAKKVRVVFEDNLENILTNYSKWGEEQLIKIEWAISSFPGNRKYQKIYILPVSESSSE